MDQLNKTDIGKFSLPEALSYDNGRTSGSKVFGGLSILTGCIGFLSSSIATIAGNVNSIALAGIASGIILAGLTLFGYVKKQDVTNTANIVQSNQ